MLRRRQKKISREEILDMIDNDNDGLEDIDIFEPSEEEDEEEEREVIVVQDLPVLINDVVIMASYFLFVCKNLGLEIPTFSARYHSLFTPF
jgi:hypothetical protein